MMNKFYKNLKKIIKKLLSLFLNHKIKEIGIVNKKIQFGSFPIIDLSKSLCFDKTKGLLCSYEGDSSFISSNEYPVIESWVKIQNISYTINDIFLYEQYKKIKKTEKKKITYFNENVYLLPYYTSHFGHFTGDLLGQILYYIKNVSEINEDNKLLIITPSEEWDNFLKHFAKENIKLVKPKDALSTNYLFNNAKILPRMSSVQNYLLAKNILNGEIKVNNKLPKKVFLTTGRQDRISNIDEVKKELQSLGFEVVIPSNYNIFDLLTIVKSANVLISEKASVLNNVHLVRNRKYFLLSSITEKNLDMKLFIGAGIYKEFNRGIAQEIHCEDDPVNQNVRAFKKRIRVKTDVLLSIIKNEYN